MLTLTEIQERLSDRNLQEVARRTGLDPATLYRFANGDAVDPKHRTMQILSDYLNGAPSQEVQ